MWKTLIVTLFVAYGCGNLEEVDCDFNTNGVCVRTKGLQGSKKEVAQSLHEIPLAFLQEAKDAEGLSLEDLVNYHKDKDLALLADNEVVAAGGSEVAVTKHSWNYSQFHIFMRDDYSACWAEAHPALIHEFLHIYSYLLYDDVDGNHSNRDFFDHDAKGNTYNRIWSATYDNHQLDGHSCER